MIEKLREQIIDQIKIRNKLRHDLEQVQNNYKTDIREREQIEEMFHRDLTAAKDEIRERRALRRVSFLSLSSCSPECAERVSACLECEERSGEATGRVSK